MDPLQLARARLARVECLTQAGFIAEAASAFAAVLTGKSVPTTTGDYAGRRYTVQRIETSILHPALSTAVNVITLILLPLTRKQHCSEEDRGHPLAATLLWFNAAQQQHEHQPLYLVLSHCDEPIHGRKTSHPSVA